MLTRIIHDNSDDKVPPQIWVRYHFLNLGVPKSGFPALKTTNHPTLPDGELRFAPVHTFHFA